MGVIQRVVKPKTHRGKRALVKREPKLIENPRQAIFLRGVKCSDTIITLMKDLTKLKKPNSVYFSRKHEFRPFEAANEVEGICKKYDASLFGFASHNKKRPHNLVLGRMYDSQLLDMVEFGVENFKGLDHFKNAKITVGCKPCLIFMGDSFQTPSSDFFRVKNLLIDFFHGEEIINIRLEGIEHVLSFLAIDNKIIMKSYRVVLKKSGEKVPFVELNEIGPSADLTLRRTKLASADLFKSACRQPQELKVKKVKNISKDPFGSKLGRIHMPKQNLAHLPTRNMKGLKKTVAEKKLERAERAKQNKEQKAQKTHESGIAPPRYGTRSERKRAYTSKGGLSGANLTPLTRATRAGATPISASTNSPRLLKGPSSATTTPSSSKRLNLTSSIKVSR